MGRAAASACCHEGPGATGARLGRWHPGCTAGLCRATCCCMALGCRSSRHRCSSWPCILHAGLCALRPADCSPQPCTPHTAPPVLTPAQPQNLPAQHLAALGLHPVLGTLHPAARAPLILHPTPLIPRPAHCAPCFHHPAPPCWFSTASHCQSWGQVPVPTPGTEPTGASPGAPPTSRPQPRRRDRSRPEATVRAPLPSRQRRARGELSTTPTQAPQHGLVPGVRTWSCSPAPCILVRALASPQCTWQPPTHVHRGARSCPGASLPGSRLAGPRCAASPCPWQDAPRCCSHT